MEEAARSTAEATGEDAARNRRIANLLRGGILYVKIVKSMDETEDGIPARASQVSVWLQSIISPKSVATL